MSEKITTPVNVAARFLTRFQEYRAGKMNGPVFDADMVEGIVNSIKYDPVGMVSFFVQSQYLIKRGLDEEYGENSKISVLGLMEWSNVMYGFFVPLMSTAMRTAAELARGMPELIESGVGIPDADPSEVFKNIEGFDMEWITPETQGSDDIPPEASGKTEDKPE